MRPHDCSSCHSPTPCHLSLITSHYVRYSLIRCLIYTNDPAEAEHIAACALARACLASQRLGGMADAGLLVELLLESVAREQRTGAIDGERVTSDRRQVTSGMRELRSRWFASTPSICDNLRNLRINPSVFFRVFRGLESVPTGRLLVPSIQAVAEVLNSMRRFARDLLILHYIEGLSRGELGEVHRVAVARVRIALAEARLDFIERLGEQERSVCGAHPARLDVRAVLTQLAEGLNQESVRTIGEIVRQFLADIE
jgi:hypothetical protein